MAHDQAITLEKQADAAAARRALPEAEALLARAAALDGSVAERWVKLSSVRRGMGDLPGALDAAAAAPLNDGRLGKRVAQGLLGLSAGLIVLAVLAYFKVIQASALVLVFAFFVWPHLGLPLT